MSDTKPPTLLIVMGTSGSGKSTVGSALSTHLRCPFVDGDDLHPSSNVAKMSSGQPLTDADREPWLLRIRRTGLELAVTQKIPEGVKGSDGQIRKLAEVYETSAQTKDVRHTQAQTGEADEVEGSKSQLAIIACSSLKLVYRRLLRGSIQSLADPKATQPEADAPTPTDLKVVHVYLDLSRQMLEKRMAGRKGHFMKLDMLYSQLDTLQVPDEEGEVGVVRVKVDEDTGEDEVVRRALEGLRKKGVI